MHIVGVENFKWMCETSVMIIESGLWSIALESILS